MKALVLVALAACGAGPRFLGEKLPRECTMSYLDCAAELQIAGDRDGFSIDDRPLTNYVAAVTARIAKASTLTFVPRVYVMPVGSAAVMGHNIVIGRQTIMGLGSEAELAGILAHETAHMEAGNNETSYIGNPVDEEAVADERAVVLLAHAGYPPAGMADALTRLGEDLDDGSHPPIKLRIQRTRLLAELMAIPPRDDGRAAFLHAIDGRIVGAIRERGTSGTRAWIVADRDITVPLPAEVADISNSTDMLSAWHDNVRYGAWRIGPRAGVEAIDALVDPQHVDLAVGAAMIGSGAPQTDDPDGSLARLLASQHRRVGKVDPDETGAVIDTPRGPLLVAVKGTNAKAHLLAWLPLLRRPTPAERVLATSPRLKLMPAPHAAPVKELVASCVDPKAALELDDPDRTIARGEPFKCTDR